MTCTLCYSESYREGYHGPEEQHQKALHLADMLATLASCQHLACTLADRDGIRANIFARVILHAGGNARSV